MERTRLEDLQRQRHLIDVGRKLNQMGLVANLVTAPIIGPLSLAGAAANAVADRWLAGREHLVDDVINQITLEDGEKSDLPPPPVVN
jgi:hypothetical protein